MKIKLVLLLILIPGLKNSFAQGSLDIIKSQVASASDYQYDNSLEELQNGERWGFHSRPLGSLEASSCLESQGVNNYDINNIVDINLKTAWVEGKNDYGIGEFFTYSIEFDPDTKFGGSGQFFGKLEVFNGYCKNEKLWEQNSRVKQLKVYLNSTPLCIIELQDTWQYQSVYIGHYFKNLAADKNLDAKNVLKNGDRLKFEIVEIYPGTKYKDVAISEFLAAGAPN